jgi:hypothetical protein
MSSLERKSPKLIVLWTLWLAMVMSITINQAKLGGGILHGRNALAQGMGFPVPLVLAQLCAATVVRWLLVPRTKDPRKLLILMIIGLALSESGEFNGIFLVAQSMPETKMAIFYLSLVSALQFIPFYASSGGVPAPGDNGQA